MATLQNAPPSSLHEASYMHSLRQSLVSIAVAGAAMTAIFVISQCFETPPVAPRFFQLTKLFGIVLAVNISGWLISACMKTDKLYDMVGTGSFVIATMYTLLQSHVCCDWSSTIWWRQFVISTLCLVWAVRLGSYLMTRVSHRGESHRFGDVKYHPIDFLSFWFGQVMWITLVGLPVYLVNLQSNAMVTSRMAHGSSSSSIMTSMSWIDGFTIGLALFIAGFCLGAQADHEKEVYKRSRQSSDSSRSSLSQPSSSLPPSNDSCVDIPWIDTGLWSESRHPNHLGEMMVWLGIAMFAIDSLPPSFPLTLACLSSPIFVTLQLTCLGDLPSLDSQAKTRWADHPHYQSYVARTGSLLPLAIEKMIH